MKNKLLALCTTATTFIVPLSFIGCSNNVSNDTFISKEFAADLKTHEFKNIDQVYMLKDIEKYGGNSHDAVMDYWIDGDTPVVKKISPLIKDESSYHIRIQAIDTPELHTEGELTKGKELKYAQKAKEFGEKVIPKGTKFKLISNDDKSYERVVGSLFYQVDPTQPSNDPETIYKSYAAEIIKEGLCLPFADPSLILNENNIVGLIGPSIADSYNWAIKHKKGMFSEEVNDILGVHGATDDSGWRWRSKRPEDSDANAFDYIDVK